MKSLHKIVVAAAVAAVLLAGCSAGGDPASNEQDPTSTGQNEPCNGGAASTEDASAEELCAQIMASVSWLDGIEPGPAELADSASADLGDFTQLRCTFGDGNVGGVTVTMHPDAFGDEEDYPSNAEPYEGTDLKPAYVRNNGSQVHVRSGRGFDISMDVSSFVDGESEIRDLADVNELANAVNDVLDGVS